MSFARQSDFAKNGFVSEILSLVAPWPCIIFLVSSWVPSSHDFGAFSIISRILSPSPFIRIMVILL
ncbi:hypothetical protein HYDPIDRAFT_118641 [Hydnomerulius pinastri MD-312]|uniref:Uncharacterized protein n=1 Tax=Hydnomerulius pinastri MD-312 TaxID=994086 RepID=A0A0C9W0D5_9AGAM|nr:hypothetical protein HYDPIDRAFT_118641 [Hydnomerulius pinastri MD-312]